LGSGDFSQIGYRLAGFRKLAFENGQIVTGLQRQDKLPAGSAARVLRQQFFQLVELEDFGATERHGKSVELTGA
jgi:hypothetical protein